MYMEQNEAGVQSPRHVLFLRTITPQTIQHETFNSGGFMQIRGELNVESFVDPSEERCFYGSVLTLTICPNFQEWKTDRVVLHPGPRLFKNTLGVDAYTRA